MEVARSGLWAPENVYWMPITEPATQNLSVSNSNIPGLKYLCFSLILLLAK